MGELNYENSIIRSEAFLLSDDFTIARELIAAAMFDEEGEDNKVIAVPVDKVDPASSLVLSCLQRKRNKVFCNQTLRILDLCKLNLSVRF